jgi:hypothetical protein
VTLVSRFLHFAYDLATGSWSVETTDGRPKLRLEATPSVELLDPDGQRIERSVAASALFRVIPIRAASTASRSSIKVERCWPDGLVATQSFELDLDTAALTTTLAVRSAQTVRFSARSLLPVSPRQDDVANLFAASDLDFVLDVGWTARAPAQRWPITESADVVATGLAALGGPGDQRAVVIAFLDGRDVVGEYRLRRVTGRGVVASDPSNPNLILSVRAWPGDVDIGPDGISSGPLWLCVDRVDSALTRFAEMQRGSARSCAGDGNADVATTARLESCHCSLWLAAQPAAPVARSAIRPGRMSVGAREITASGAVDQPASIPSPFRSS